MLREGWERLDLALRSLIWASGTGISSMTDVIFDDQAFQLLGIKPVDIHGTAAEYFGVIHPDDREKVRAALARTIDQNAPYESEYRVIWRTEASITSPVAEGWSGTRRPTGADARHSLGHHRAQAG